VPGLAPPSEAAPDQPPAPADPDRTHLLGGAPSSADDDEDAQRTQVLKQLPKDEGPTQRWSS
jgi:hypothetical protein